MAWLTARRGQSPGRHPLRRSVPSSRPSADMKDDPQFNIQFVKCVEKHPCLYNHNIIEYSNREEQERAWQEVAAEIKASVTDCKNKWKNLRGSLTRYLLRSRGPQFGEKPIKPYYMYEALRFLIPFTKTRKPRGARYEAYEYGNGWPDGSLEQAEDGSFQSISECYEDEVIPWGDGSPCTAEVDLEETDEEVRIGSPEIQVSEGSLPPPPPAKRPRTADLTKLEEGLIGCLRTLSQSQQTNPDLEFFKSILPDIANFTPRQKRIFKQGILRLIDEVEDDEEERKGREEGRTAPPSSTSN